MRKAIAVLGAALLAAGCGETKKGFDEGFDKNFHESFVSSCIKSAIQAGAEQGYADGVCKCASEKIRERFSVREKMSLTNKEIMPIVRQCREAERS
jgi:hypothetical protein